MEIRGYPQASAPVSAALVGLTLGLCPMGPLTRDETLE